MKNLKKVLSLALALAMALGLMTVAFAADASDYNDYKDVTYNEAVDVMTAIGVFNGTGDGTNFSPTGELTGLEFAKMLLGALGYDADIKKMTGSTWAINTATLAISSDLDDGMEEISLSNALTREQAAQMAFNTLNADVVRYANKGTNIDLGNGTTVVIGTTPATTVEVNGANVNYNGATSADHDYDTQQFAEKYISQLKLVNKTAKYPSSANEWNFKGVTSDGELVTWETSKNYGVGGEDVAGKGLVRSYTVCIR